MDTVSQHRLKTEKLHNFVKQLGVLTGLSLIIYFLSNTMDFGYDFHWAVLYEINPTYEEIFGFRLLKGLALTVNISIISSLIALLIGTLFGVGRLSRFKPVYYFSTTYVEFFRNTPLLVQMFFWYFAFPMLLPEATVEFLNENNFEFVAAVIALSTYTGSYVAEIVRAGIQAVPRGHVEAAKASGFTYTQVLRYVVLPQAFRIIIPPLGSEMLNNMKNSSLAMTIGVAELCWQSQQIESFTFKGFEATSAASIIYLGLCILISLIMNSVNSHLKVGSEKSLNLFDRFLGGLFLPVKALFLLVSMAAIKVLSVFDTQEKDNTLQQSVKTVSGHLITGAKYLVYILTAGAILYALKGVWSLNWGVMWANLKPMLIWNFLSGEESDLFNGLGGLSLSFLMAIIVISTSFFIGIAIGLGRLSKNPILNTPSVLYIEIIRGNPLIMVIFWVYFFSPILTGIQMDVFWSATIAFIIFSGAYLAEIVRAGVLAIPPGQMEAATAAGFSYFQTMRFIILPQALKIMIPAFVGQFITIFKDTSLAYIIGVFELTTAAQTISNRLMIYPFEIYVTIGLLYFICCYSMSVMAGRLERKLA